MESRWKPVSLPGLIAWMIFYCAFLLYAATNQTGFLFIDNANLVVHEGGHLLFGWFGYSIGIWGGTLLQWLVPLMLAGFFFVQRETVGFTFCVFFFFENWLYTAAYMADARAMVLPLVTVGDTENTVHDWNFIFSQLNLLSYDTVVANIVRVSGWLGMIATVCWLAYRYSQKPATLAGDPIINSQLLKK
jgi:hypothetical protein